MNWVLATLNVHRKYQHFISQYLTQNNAIICEETQQLKHKISINTHRLHATALSECFFHTQDFYIVVLIQKVLYRARN